jgi:hypothetical protein
MAISTSSVVDRVQGSAESSGRSQKSSQEI